MRMTGCERQTQPGSSAESRALSAHRMPRARARPLAARATWSRPCGRRGWPLGRGGQGASGPDVWVSRPHSSPRAGRAGLLSEPHGGPRDGQGSSPHPPASTRILHGSHAPRGEEVQRAAGDDAVGGGGEGLTHVTRGVADGLGRCSCQVTWGIRRPLFNICGNSPRKNNCACFVWLKGLTGTIRSFVHSARMY